MGIVRCPYAAVTLVNTFGFVQCISSSFLQLIFSLVWVKFSSAAWSRTNVSKLLSIADCQVGNLQAAICTHANVGMYTWVYCWFGCW